MAMKRVCDVCKTTDMTAGVGYQMSAPSVLHDNEGITYEATGRSPIDVCGTCMNQKGQQVVDAIMALVPEAVKTQGN